MSIMQHPQFQQGMQILSSTSELETLKHTVFKLLTLAGPSGRSEATDLIARTLRQKQIAEIRSYSAFPHVLQEIDKKYSVLAQVLRGKDPNTLGSYSAPTEQDSAPPPPSESPKQPSLPNPLAKINPMFALLGNPLHALAWLKDHKSTLFAGASALTLAAGGYYFYSKSGKKKKNPKESDSGFDKTIKSIQRYKLFSQLCKDPDLTLDDLSNFMNGKTPKRAKPSKKDREQSKVSEWDQHERALMKNLDNTFNALTARPKLEYDLPQLPGPKKVKPPEITTTPVDFGSMSESATKSRPRKKRRKKQDESTEASPPPTTPEENKGRLIPIVKRTKRIKKVSA